MLTNYGPFDLSKPVACPVGTDAVASIGGVGIDLSHPALEGQAWVAEYLHFSAGTGMLVVNWCASHRRTTLPDEEFKTGTVILAPGDRLIIEEIAKHDLIDLGVAEIDQAQASAKLVIEHADGATSKIEQPLAIVREGAVLNNGPTDWINWLEVRLAALGRQSFPEDRFLHKDAKGALSEARRALKTAKRTSEDIRAYIKKEFQNSGSKTDESRIGILDYAIWDAACFGYKVAKLESTLTITPVAHDGLIRRKFVVGNARRAALLRTNTAWRDAAREIWADHPTWSQTRVANVVLEKTKSKPEQLRSIQRAIPSVMPLTSVTLTKRRTKSGSR